MDITHLFALGTRVGDKLVARKETIAVAESSAGGLISAALLSRPAEAAGVSPEPGRHRLLDLADLVGDLRTEQRLDVRGDQTAVAGQNLGQLADQLDINLHRAWFFRHVNPVSDFSAQCQSFAAASSASM